jgi:hypothetical protein
VLDGFASAGAASTDVAAPIAITDAVADGRCGTADVATGLLLSLATGRAPGCGVDQSVALVLVAGDGTAGGASDASVAGSLLRIAFANTGARGADAAAPHGIALGTTRSVGLGVGATHPFVAVLAVADGDGLGDARATSSGETAPSVTATASASGTATAAASGRVLVQGGGASVGVGLARSVSERLALGSSTSSARGRAAATPTNLVPGAASSTGAGAASALARLVAISSAAGSGASGSLAIAITFDVPFTEAAAAAAGCGASFARGVALHAIDPAAPPVRLLVEAVMRVEFAASATRGTEVVAIAARSVEEVVHADPAR